MAWSALAPSPQRRKPRHRRLGSGIRFARSLAETWKRRAMLPTVPSGNTMPRTRPTGSWRVNSKRAGTMRSNYRIPVFKPAADGVEPWLNLTDAARFLKVSTRTLRLAAEAGEIEALHPLPDGPWVFARTALATDAAQSITVRARQNPKYRAGSQPAQQNLFASIT